MANAVKSAPAPRAARSKSAAQLEKKARNERLAAERLARLQARQKLVNTLKKQGFTGTDDQIIETFNNQQRLAEAAAYCKAVYAVPVAGLIIQRWLKNRITMAPIQVADLIRRFLNRDGSIEGQRDNSKLKAMVEAALNPAAAKVAA
jgi:hypothetical protein